MKKILQHLTLILIPSISFGQLFPSVSDFNGDITKVIELNYGREIYLFNRWTGINIPRCYSGWKYVYYFDEYKRLNRRVNTFKGKIRADYIYEYDSTENITIEREIVNEPFGNDKGNYVEDEYIFNSNGQIEKVNIWSFHAIDSSKEIIVVEKNIKRDSINKITSYYRYGFDKDGEEINGVLYVLYYDSLARVIRIEERDIEKKTKSIEFDNQTKTLREIPNSKPEKLKQISISKSELLRQWLYEYNSKGQTILYAINYYGELNKASSNGAKVYKLFFKYDENNNWIKMYKQVGTSKKRLAAKRKIRYR